MFDSSRQDDLLNRLKSCVGGLKQENIVQDTLSKQSITMMKDNPLQFKEPFIPNPNATPHKMQNFGSPNYQRRPMAPIVNEPLTSRRTPPLDYINQKSKRSCEVFMNTKQNYYQSSQQFKLNEELNRYKAGLNSAKNRQFQPPQQLNSFKLMQNNRQSQIKNSIARRYAFGQNQKTNNLSVAQIGYSYLRQKPTVQKQIQVSKPQPKKYREELEQRKNLINQDFNYPEKPILSARKEVVPGFIRKQNIPVSSQKQAWNQEKVIRNNYQQQPLLAKTFQNNTVIFNEKPLVRESLKKSLQAQEGDCSALAKLKKISQLNEKINERIRNIINVFEQQK